LSQEIQYGVCVIRISGIFFIDQLKYSKISVLTQPIPAQISLPSLIRQYHLLLFSHDFIAHYSLWRPFHVGKLQSKPKYLGSLYFFLFLCIRFYY